MKFHARALAVGLGLALLTGTLCARAGAAVLCRKRSGRVVVAESCGKKKTTLTGSDLGLVGPSGSSGATGAAGDAGVLPYRVTDATGHQVGILQSFIGDRAQVVLTHASLPGPIQVEVAGGVIVPGIFADAVYYESADCSGTGFVREGGSPLPRAELVGDTLYYATEEPVSHDFSSIETETAPCTGGTPTARGTCCRAQSQTLRGAAASAVLLATLGITEPLDVVPRP